MNLYVPANSGGIHKRAIVVRQVASQSVGARTRLERQTAESYILDFCPSCRSGKLLLGLAFDARRTSEPKMEPRVRSQMHSK